MTPHTGTIFFQNGLTFLEKEIYYIKEKRLNKKFIKSKNKFWIWSNFSKKRDNKE